MAENPQAWLPETEKNNYKIDYAGGGKYCLFQSKDETPAKIIKESKNILVLIRYIVRSRSKKATVELSDSCEFVYSLEVTDGQDHWVSDLD